LQRLINGDAIDSLQTKHHDKYGDSKMIFEENNQLNKKVGYSLLKGWEYSKCKTTKENEHANKVFSRICSMEHYLHNKYYERFFYIFKKYVQHWWI
jgi:hypothetical protein